MRRLIETEADIAEGIAALTRAEPRFALARDAVAEVPLRRNPHGFGALLRVILGQQVSTASAAALWARLDAAGLTTPEAIAATPQAVLCSHGLSRPKARYAHALAAAQIDFAALAALPDEAVIATLTGVPGIGRWTAEVYAMLSLGRADIFAPGDLALQEAARGLFGLAARPREAELRAMAAGWSPWRGVAARLLWAYYRVMTKREGIAP
ncbi:DNA-3-methyladenine glycosylase family protein [Sinisalibacter aestuarii]|uniref:DNA-3-methyladenine glycosylase II n=1 Tax=Sinisalibacter aestuarii TaxID=2949426 RepID=A0ABQ5LSC4_9RHOB|nr:DNA-3-methyladenine glycosylase 2 family protein [Sinisalibacter aestuarii]GKY87904.1 3-methyladenine DNA glycosylase [Sinisalibacter aestuarii]